MKTKAIFLMVVFTIWIGLLIPFSDAQSQPRNVNPFVAMRTPVIYEIGQPTAPAAGGTCAMHWAQRNSYCSGDIRQYEQCIPTSTTQGAWQPRSENCADYEWICFAGDCQQPDIYYYFMNYGLFIIKIIIIAAIIWKVKK